VGLLRPVLLIAALGALPTGCAKPEPAALPAETAPLSVEQWKRIPEEEKKYDPKTVQRVRRFTARTP
jgi:hypothetical protein